LQCGDDLIAFGTSATTGVSYIIPSENPTDGTAVPSTENYDAKAFAVAGRTIFLVGHVGSGIAFQVSALNVDTEILAEFTVDEIRLNTIKSQGAIGSIQADGDYCAVICSQNDVADGKIIKVIDVSGDEAALIAFDQNPADTAFQVAQVAVDAATKTVVAVANDTFFVYDIDAPDAAPVQIAAPEGIGDTQMKIAGGYIIALDDQGYPMAFLVDLANETVIALPNAEAASALGVAINDNHFAFFADATAEDRLGGLQATAVGALPGPGFTKAASGNQIDGSTDNNGWVGYAGSMGIVPGGDYENYVFLADSYLQWSTGGVNFTVPADPDGTDPYACPAWDVDTSSSVVGFKTATTRSDNTETKVGYIILDND